MRRHPLVQLSLAAAIAIGLLGAMPAGAQALAAAKATAGAKNWAPPHRPDGQPDLEGTWSNATTVPMERPAELGTKEFYTEEEFAQQQKKFEEQNERAQGGRQTQPGTVADVHYDLAQYGLDRGHTKMAASLRTSMIVGPEGKIPPMLPAAQKRNADRAAYNRAHSFDGPETRGLSERCITWPNEGPPMLSPGYNSNLQIVQGPGYVAILQEMIHDVRMIPLDGRTHLPKTIRQWFGDSIGHWEGNTLVVDTTNFTDRTAFRGSTDSLHVVERFTRVDPDTVQYEFTVEDPATWAAPWTAQTLWTKTETPIFEYACQEGNYGMANVLSGARASERAAEQSKK